METFLSLFCLYLCFFSLALIWWFQQILTSEEDWQLTFSFFLQSIPYLSPFLQIRRHNCQGNRKEEGWEWRGMRALVVRRPISDFRAKAKQVELLTDAWWHCAIVLTMTTAIVATWHQCYLLCRVLLFVSQPSVLISSLSRSESTWDSGKDMPLSITCCVCLWGWRSLLCLFSPIRANHSPFLGWRSFIPCTCKNVPWNAAVVIEFVHVEKQYTQEKCLMPGILYTCQITWVLS